MTDVDGLLERLRFRANCANDLGMFGQCDELTKAVRTIEQQRAELSAKDRRIELMEAKLDAWHDLYGSEDWRSVIAAEMEER